MGHIVVSSHLKNKPNGIDTDIVFPCVTFRSHQFSSRWRKYLLRNPLSTPLGITKTMSHSERSPLLDNTGKSNDTTDHTPTESSSRDRKQQDVKGLWLVRTALLLLAVEVLSVLARIPLSVFSLHPFFMTLFIILLTEGVTTLQPTRTKVEKRQGLHRHAIIQLFAFLSAITGFSAIFYNKVLANKDHFTSGHGKLGLSVIAYLIFQASFGIVCAFVPGLSPAIKNLWKYHRVTGYLLLSLVWITAVFGLQADYIVANNWLIPTSFLLSNWLLLAVVFVVISVSLRVRFYKLKGQVHQ